MVDTLILRQERPPPGTVLLVHYGAGARSLDQLVKKQPHAVPRLWSCAGGTGQGRRRWPDKDEWARRCSEEGPWREVRVLDADNLEGWLESNYVVHVRVSEQLGRRPLEAESLDRWWPRWADQTDPVLPPALLLAGRRAEAEKLCAALTGPPKVTGVRAASREEALAFGAVALSTVKDDVSASPAAVVVKSLAVWDRCAASPGPAILIPPRVEGIDLPAAVRQGHPVLISYGSR